MRRSVSATSPSSSSTATRTDREARSGESRRSRIRGIVRSAGAGAVLLAACSAPPSSTTTTMPSPDPASALADFAGCMGEHGVDLAAPDGSGLLAPLFARLDADPEVLAEAVDSCAGLLDAGGGLETDDDAVAAAVDERLAVVAACVRLRGVEAFPDPVDGRLPVELIPFEDPDLAAAVDECRPLLPPP